MSTKFVLDTISANQAWFAGMYKSATDMRDVDPSSQVNLIGIGDDAGDTNLQLITNDNAGTETKTDLGSNFPVETSGVVYELRLFCKPNDTVVYYSIQRLDVPQSTEGSVSADLPQITLALAPQIHGGTRATLRP
jgi:hypothetical protein